MVVKAANFVWERSEGSVFKRLSSRQNVNARICVYWLEGKCNRNPCRFLHTELTQQLPRQSRSRTHEERHSTQPISTRSNPNNKSSKIGTTLANDKISVVKAGPVTQKTVSITRGSGFEGKDTPKPQMKLCKNGVNDNFLHRDKCKDLNARSSGNDFSMLAKLEGHSMAVTGIALPSGSSQLYSGSKDKSVRIWDCHSGQCADVIMFDQEIGCLVGEGPCVFVGLPNVIKAWNIQTKMELDLSGPNGQVHAMIVYDNSNMLFAGIEDGTILVWKSSSENMHPELVALLKDHSQAVFSLVVGANRLYSASKDNTIKVWDLKTLQCLHTLYGHTDAVMSVLCWDSFLISGSLDNTIKVWAATESGSLEVTYEHRETSGVLAFGGIHDAEGRPILICSCNDNIVHLYDLPSFCERGRIYTAGEARSVQIAAGGLFFTGDVTGQISVWKLLGERNSTSP